MKPADYTKLENNKDFKKKYLGLTSWWKNILIIPSILFLFLGLFGMLYLMHHDSLISYYAIPFIVAFMIGTIWFKSVKRHIYNTMLNDESGFKVCAGGLVHAEKGFTYLILINGQKRHNEHFIQQLAKDIDKDNIILLASKRKQTPILIQDKDIDYYAIAVPTSNISKYNPTRNETDSIPLLFVNSKKVLIIKGKDLHK